MARLLCSTDTVQSGGAVFSDWPTMISDLDVGTNPSNHKALERVPEQGKRVIQEESSPPFK